MTCWVAGPGKGGQQTSSLCGLRSRKNLGRNAFGYARGTEIIGGSAEQ